METPESAEKELVLTKTNSNKSEIVYIRMPLDLKAWVDSVATSLNVKRSEAIRKVLEAARANGVKFS